MKNLILTTILLLALTSCGDNNQTTTDTNNSTDITTDSITTPSITDSSEEVRASLSEDGNWITCATSDIVLNEELIVSGDFYNKDDKSQGLYRKLALYTQDEDKNVTDTFSLTTPSMTVLSENFRIQEGIVNGDIYVNANGFELKNCTIEGSLIFENEEYKNTASIDEGTVTGEIE